jgi:LPS-assembly lipoprotein
MASPFAKSSWFPARSSTLLSDLKAAYLKRTWRPLGLALWLGLALPLSACGFHPLYGDNGATSGDTVTSGLWNISVSAPNNSTGRTLKFDLLDIISPNGDQPVDAEYRLDLRPTSYSRNVAVQTDASVTRANYVLVVPFRLYSVETGKVVYRGTARSRSSYNRSDSEFANIAAANDAEKRTAKSVANDIKLQLSIYFDRQARDGKTAMK